MEYLHGPQINTTRNPIKNKIAFSFLEKESPACEINAATNMVMIGKMEKSLALNPKIMTIGTTNLPKTTKYNDFSFPSPIGS